MDSSSKQPKLPFSIDPKSITLRIETIEWIRNMLRENGYEPHTIVFKLEYYSDACLVTALGPTKKLSEFTITRKLTPEMGEAVLKKMRSVLNQEAAVWKTHQERRAGKDKG